MDGVGCMSWRTVMSLCSTMCVCVCVCVRVHYVPLEECDLP